MLKTLLIVRKTKSIISTLLMPYQRLRLRKRVFKQLSENKPLKIVIGAGGVDIPGWILTDIPVLDVLEASHWATIFQKNTIDRVLAEHVFEHLTEEQLKIFLHNVRPYLAPESFIRIAVPDGFHPSSEYIEYVRPGGIGEGADDHKILYNYQLFQRLIEECQYAYRLLEYFDENGQFHQLEWSAEDGMIRRSKDHDARNQQQPLSYTSLIIDLWKVE